jgi:PKD repeat protein
MLIMTGLLLIIAAVPALDGNWTLVNGSAQFPARYQHASVVYAGSLWVIGGFFDDGGPGPDPFYNDTWHSSDGNVWYRTNRTAGFPERAGHTTLVSNNRMWVIAGGDFTALMNDTWYSSDGDLWYLANSSPEFPARFYHTSVVYNGLMWVTGGVDDTGAYLNDSWYSSDGDLWHLSNASAEFPARLSHTSLNYNSRMWVIGGQGDGGTSRNDVWYSSDGEQWHLSNASAEFPARYAHTSVVYDNRMWVIGGMDITGTVLDDAWYSSDGIIWNEAIVTTSPTARYYPVSGVINSKIVIAGGSTGIIIKNDTWSFLSSPVAEFTATPRSGSAPLSVTFTSASTGYPTSYAWVFGDGGTSAAASPTHTYTEPGTYPVSLTVINSDGTSTATKTAYISVMTPAPQSSDNSGGDTSSSTDIIWYRPSTVTVNVGGDAAVTRVTVTGTGLSDLIVTGTVRSDPGPGIPPAPGIVYQYIDLVPARYNTITDSEQFFTVPIAWLEDHGTGPDAILMYYYSGSSWEPLPTTILSTMDGRVFFSSQGSAFSLFAISAKTSGRQNDVVAGVSPQMSGDLLQEPGKSAVVTSPATVETSPPPQLQPVDPSSDSPLMLVAVLAACCAGLLVGGFFVRRWWIRRQNPVLFQEYK